MTCYRLRTSYFCLQLTTATSGIFSIIFVIRGTSGVEQLRNTSIHLKREIKNAILIDAFYYKFPKSEQALQRNWLTFVGVWPLCSLVSFVPPVSLVSSVSPVFPCGTRILFLHWTKLGCKFKSQRGYFQIFFVSLFCFMVFLPFGWSPFILITDSF